MLQADHVREERPDLRDEPLDVRRQLRARQQLQHVAKVVPRVERQPVRFLVEHEPGGHDGLSEVLRGVRAEPSSGS